MLPDVLSAAACAAVPVIPLVTPVAACIILEAPPLINPNIPYAKNGIDKEKYPAVAVKSA